MIETIIAFGNSPAGAVFGLFIGFMIGWCALDFIRGFKRGYRRSCNELERRFEYNPMDNDK